MSVHSTHYDESEEYERDLKWEYRREQWEQDHLEDLEYQPQTIPQSLEEVVSEMCDKYCKWPLQWDEEAQGCELSESDVCANCPLNRLV